MHQSSPYNSNIDPTLCRWGFAPDPAGEANTLPQPPYASEIIGTNLDIHLRSHKRGYGRGITKGVKSQFYTGLIGEIPPKPPKSPKIIELRQIFASNCVSAPPAKSILAPQGLESG